MGTRDPVAALVVVAPDRPRPPFRRIGVTALLVTSLAVPATRASAGPGDPTMAPTYSVVSSGLTAGQSAALASALRIRVIADTGAAFQFVDRKRFLKIPQRGVQPIPGSQADEDGRRVASKGLRLAAIKPALSDDAALASVSAALASAGISLDGATAHADDTYLEMFGTDGTMASRQAIGTGLTYSFATPDGTPLEGPGAKAVFSFDRRGRATMALVAVRSIVPGPSTPIIPHDDALAACGAGAPAGSSVTADLVYYALPLSLGSVSVLLPHYRCGGTVPDPTGGAQPISLLEHYVPATVPGTPFAPPAANVSGTLDGEVVSAQVDVTGGTPPYSVTWGSSNTTLLPSGSGASVTYDLVSREPTPASETVVATVTDANGLTVSSEISLIVNAPVSVVPIPGDEQSKGTVGLDYMSFTANPPVPVYAAFSPLGLMSAAMAASPSVTIGYAAGELAAYETDVRTNTNLGHDDQYLDNVDLGFYLGHGSPGIITFSSLHDYHAINLKFFLRLGDKDAEWFALESCQVLNNTDGQVVARLGPVFQGLHSLLGFDSNAVVEPNLGGIFGDFLFGTATNPNSHSLGAHLTVVQAWALAAILTNPSDRVWAAMGPYGPNAVSDVADHFWGFGSTGPDIRGSFIQGYWRLVGST